ncbi:MAG: Rieske (2Fe-2S) protein [Candidatus Tectomicrobia bacterium]|nr:Rieske (2Fe-2S) protein [Candidatus Tectomicrobia bacterium]
MKRLLSRRTFSNLFLGGGFLLWAGTIFQAAFRFLLPPKLASAGQPTVVAAKTGELQPNSGKIFRFGSIPGIVIKTPGGEVRAFNAVCTHLACTVQYREDLAHIWCACHNGHYDLFGRNVGGPPPRPLEELQVALRGDQVMVTRKA